MLYRSVCVFSLLSCVFLVSATAQNLITDISVPGTPYGIAVDSNTNRIYVAVVASSGPEVAVIDGSTNEVVENISTPLGSDQLAMNVATGRLYDGGCNLNTTSRCAVSVIDTNSNVVVAKIPVEGPGGIGVQGIALNPITNQVFVSDDQNYSIEVIDGTTNTATYIYDGHTEMLGLAVDWKSNQLIGAPSGGVMDIINPVTAQVTHVKVGQINANVAVNSSTARAYITNDTGESDTLGVVNLNTDKVVTNIDTGSDPFGVCVDSASNLIFVGNLGSGTVTEVDGANNTVIGTVNASNFYMDVNPQTRTVYATSNTYGENVVHVISE